MSTETNLNLNNVANTGNTGAIAQGAGAYLEPGLIRALVLVPVSDSSIPATAMVSQAAFAAYVNAKFVADNRQDRWFMFGNLDGFKDDTKKTSSEDTGVFQTQVFKYAPKYSFRYMTGMGNFQEALQFNNCQSKYNFYWIDSNGAWNGWANLNGDGALNAYTLYQLFVNDIGRTTDKTLNQYMIDVQAKNREQYNEQFAYFAANFDFDAVAMLQNVWMQDVSDVLHTPLSTDTDTQRVVTIKYNQYASDFIQAYQGVLTAGCFTAFNLTSGTTQAIATVTFGEIVVSNQTYYYALITFTTNPSGDVRISLAAPSVVNGVIPNANVVCEKQNAAIVTF